MYCCVLLCMGKGFKTYYEHHKTEFKVQSASHSGLQGLFVARCKGFGRICIMGRFSGFPILHVIDDKIKSCRRIPGKKERFERATNLIVARAIAKTRNVLDLGSRTPPA
jgi:hypothetical protein